MTTTLKEIQETLDWYIFAGVQETCGDNVCLSQPLPMPFSDKTPALSPVSQSALRFSNQAGEVPLTIASNRVSDLQGITAADHSASVKNAKDICGQAQNLDELKELMLKFDGCNLKNTAASTVFGDGNPHARLMLIGEAPGADEDRIGKPFVGRCGKLLDKMFSAIQISRSDCYITNVLPWRPPGNRTPTDEEKAVCLPFLQRQIELILPDYILLLGGIALNSVMNTPDSISRTRGKWLVYSANQKEIQVLATYHPSYLLRTPAKKANVWADLLRLKVKMKENLVL